MKKIITVIGLLGVLSQPAIAQPFSTGTPVFSSGNNSCIQATPLYVPVPTGMAVPIQSQCNAYPTTIPVQPYSVCPTTGGAAPLNSDITPTFVQSPCNICPTGGAIPVTQPLVPVTVPKKHWWEKNHTEYVPATPTTTGGAIPICPTACPVQQVSPPGCAAPLSY